MKGEPMGDCMNFPDTVDEYMEQYKMTDVRQVYSNGIEYVPIFRMKQWFEHEKAQLSQEGTTSDLISRQAAIDAAKDWYEGLICGSVNGLIKRLNALPTIQPEPKEGYWIEVAGELECSECHTVFTDLYPDYADSVACPHCGAKMTISTK